MDDDALLATAVTAAIDAVRALRYKVISRAPGSGRFGRNPSSTQTLNG